MPRISEAGTRLLVPAPLGIRVMLPCWSPLPVCPSGARQIERFAEPATRKLSVVDEPRHARLEQPLRNLMKMRRAVARTMLENLRAFERRIRRPYLPDVFVQAGVRVQVGSEERKPGPAPSLKVFPRRSKHYRAPSRWRP